LRVPVRGAQRASSHRARPVRGAILALATAFAFMTLAAHPTPAAAAGMKVVVVVGPVESSTSNYISNARRYAAQARSYGATVVELYSPNATWPRVLAAAKGANVLIYLGHGNGYPSPYGAFSAYTRDGMGLNASAGHGNANTRYWGEYYISHYLRLAPNAVVILNRLCYASGDSEWGSANPTKAVAMQRADNFGAGFLRANARAVFAIGIDSASYTLRSLFESTQSVAQIFKTDPARNLHYDFAFDSRRTSGARVWMDPYAPSRYYRSVVGRLDMTMATFRGG
jgi:hypothetical protein